MRKSLPRKSVSMEKKMKWMSFQRKKKSIEKKKKRIFTFVLAHWHFVVTIEQIGSHHAYECLMVLMAVLMNYLNRCCCCCYYHVERIHRHCYLDVSMMGWVVDLWYLVILWRKKNKILVLVTSKTKKFFLKKTLNLDQKKKKKRSSKWSVFLRIHQWVSDGAGASIVCGIIETNMKNRFQYIKSRAKSVCNWGYKMRQNGFSSQVLNARPNEESTNKKKKMIIIKIKWYYLIDKFILTIEIEACGCNKMLSLYNQLNGYIYCVSRAKKNS